MTGTLGSRQAPVALFVCPGSAAPRSLDPSLEGFLVKSQSGFPACCAPEAAAQASSVREWLKFRDTTPEQDRAGTFAKTAAGKEISAFKGAPTMP